MGDSPRRTFTLRDLIVLVAATALGFAWARAGWIFGSLEGPRDWIRYAPEMLAYVLVPWTLAILGLRLLPPRPPLSALALQPGAAACGAVAVVLAIELMSDFTLAALWSYRPSWTNLGYDRRPLWPSLFSGAVDRGPFHHAVATAWGVLAVSRQWRPERSWIDRAGRAIGILWIAVALSHWWVEATNEPVPIP